MPSANVRYTVRIPPGQELKLQLIAENLGLDVNGAFRHCFQRGLEQCMILANNARSAEASVEVAGLFRQAMESGDPEAKQLDLVEESTKKKSRKATQTRSAQRRG